MWNKARMVLATGCAAGVLLMSACQPFEGDKSDSSSGLSGRSYQSSQGPKVDDIVTTAHYQLNDEIAIGNNQDIIVKKGVWPEGIIQGNRVILGAEGSQQVLAYNFSTGDIERIGIDDGRASVVLNTETQRQDQAKVYAIAMCGNIVAWSGAPQADYNGPDFDPTNGAGWDLRYADLGTGKIVKVDGDKQLQVPEEALYRYLAPGVIRMSPDHICYQAWEQAPDGRVTNAIKLYTISTGQLQTLDYYKGDISVEGFGSPAISGNIMTWFQAALNQDGTYTGQSYVYDLKTGVKSRLITDENIIQPLISGRYIYAQGMPNRTFYDSEVCIYDVASQQWRYKINNNYSQYCNERDVALRDLVSVDGYLTWSTDIQKSLVLFNQDDDKLYNLVPYSPDLEISDLALLDGGLLMWSERSVSNYEAMPVYHYILLKKTAD